jgi:hypothetical protein
MAAPGTRSNYIEIWLSLYSQGLPAAERGPEPVVI